MAIYTVYMPPDGDTDEARFIRDGANLAALVIPAIWLIWQRLWLWLLFYVVLALAIGLAWRLVGAGIAFLAILPGVYLLLEGNELVRARLERFGWQLAAIVEAPNRADAELRFFDIPHQATKEGDRAHGSVPLADVPAPAAPRMPPQQGIGLFPE
jgi:Protein of unknown function (DUF2628)